MAITEALDYTHAAISPGQGSQEYRTGLELSQKYPEVAEMWEKSAAALEPHIGFDLRHLLWEGKRNGTDQLTPDEIKLELRRTEFAQPIVIIDAITRMKAFVMSGKLGRPPGYNAGNSVGFVRSLVDVGSLTPDAAVELSRGRSVAFQYAIDNSPRTMMMALTGVDAEIVEQVKEKYGLVTCLINSDTQVILGGEIENREGRDITHAASYLVDELKLDTRVVRKLEVDAAYHSHYMEAAVPLYEQVVKGIPIIAPTEGKVIGGSTVRLLETPEDIRSELVLQLTMTERWRDVLYYLKAQGVIRMTELSGLPILSLINRRLFDGRIDKITTDEGGPTIGYQWLAPELLEVSGGSGEARSRDDVRDFYYNWIATRRGKTIEQLSLREDLHWQNDAVLDSEDIIALRSDLFAEFGMVVSDEEAEKNVTIGLAIDATWGLIKPA